MEDDKNFIEASRLVMNGYYVSPLVADTKQPLANTHGYLDATNKVGQLAKWWKDNPQANICLNLEKSGLVVIDMDKHANNGVEKYQELYHAGKMGKLPDDTYIEKSASGLHFYYSVAGVDGIELKNHTSAFTDKSGIDILTKSVVIAPSVVNGVEYEPLNEPLALTTIVPAPRWLIDYMRPTKPIRTYKEASVRTSWTGELLNEIVEGTSDGNRNNFLTHIAGKLFRTGANSSTVLEVLAFANRHVSPPLDERELTRIYTSILKREGN